jgi:hypothetical protein
VSDDKDKARSTGGTPSMSSTKKVMRVQVVCKKGARVGPKLLKNGDITEDPAYIALLDDKRGLVRAV